MNRKFYFVLLIALIYQGCKEPMLVMSYNIRFNNPDDGDNHWDFILEEQPDVFGMQEVTHAQLLDLIEEWSEYDYLGVGREDGMTKGEYTPIFYKTVKYKVLDFNTFWLSETPDTISVGWDAALERICSYAHLEANKNGKRFWIFNTHFDHRGEKARAAAAKLLVNKIEQLNFTNDPVLLTGDFNLEPNSLPIKEITSHFKDVYYFSNDGQAHYIFYDQFSVEEASHVALKTKWGRWASDHHPVKAIFNY